jgi:hypothetical protein
MNQKKFLKHNSKRILLIHHTGNSFNNPSLKCIIELFIKEGFKVDIRYRKGSAPMPSIEGVKLLPYGKLIGKLKAISLNYICSYILLLIFIAFENLLLYDKYDFVIGVDREGLIEASALSRLTKIPYAFISFEIMFKEEVPSLYSTRYKKIEEEASKNVSLWIIQDEVRASQIQSENSLCPDKRFLLPLASSGVPKITDNKRLRDLLGIPKEKKVAIVIGSISSWSMTNEILESVINWPENWVLIVHERYGLTHATLENQSDKFRKYLGNKIFISDMATDIVDDLSIILSGISVGLAFYKATFDGQYTGKNLVYLGLASGKIATYLRYGVPVLVNKIGLYSQEIERNKIGYVVENLSQISSCLPEIEKAEYSERALNFFSKRLDFGLFEKALWENFLPYLNS